MPRIFSLFTLTCVLLLSGCNSGSDNIELYNRAQVIDAAAVKYMNYATQYAPEDGYPRAAAGKGMWNQVKPNWTSGFFPGSLWNLSYAKGDNAITEQAIRWTEPLAPVAAWDFHDLGFVINNSVGKGRRILNQPFMDSTLEKAANTLKKRFNPTIGMTRSWNSNDDRFLVIIDNMMNLELLFEAAREFSDDSLYDVGYQHALTSANEFVREDGSSFHVLTYDNETLELRKKGTHQGVSDDSTWSRGQAWGIYGFTMAYRETGDELFLQTARKMADYFIQHLPADGVPYWDFSVNRRSEPKDTAAAAIAASGIWQLSEFVDSDAQSEYQAASKALVDSMLTSEYVDIDTQHHVLLDHATGSRPNNSEVDTSLVYADYYLIEAILLQQGLTAQPL